VKRRPSQILLRALKRYEDGRPSMADVIIGAQGEYAPAVDEEQRYRDWLLHAASAAMSDEAAR
jgi:hypothetical protein